MLFSARFTLGVCTGVVMLGGLLGGVGARIEAARPSVALSARITAMATPPATPSPAPTTAVAAPTRPIPTLVPLPDGGIPAQGGQVILVSRAQQWLWVYQDRVLLFATPVTTGQPGLVTPSGTFHVLLKQADLTFTSSWPVGSPYYYAPLHVDEALYFRDIGFYIHDAPWRATFGAGTNLPHREPNGAWTTGSHGCVEVSPTAGAWLYRWADVGATIVIR